MKKPLFIVLSAFLISIFIADPAFACTTFCLKSKGEVLFGKNYDWMIGDGLVFVNKRGVSKTSSANGERHKAKWDSKYGSVTFNQYGRESPSGGMNEAGLVIELMWLDDTQYPKPDDRPAVDVLEWIQFNLDTAATTSEVIANANAVRIASAVKLHYLVNDKSGNSAAIEFLDGKLVARTGLDMPLAALANDTYARSADYARKASSTQSESSFDRFARAAKRSKDFEKGSMAEKDAVQYAFDTLSNVAQANSTQWRIVYDQKRSKIHFRTRQSPAIKTIDTARFDYGCGTTVKLFDINDPAAGDVTAAFKDYSRAANRDLIERAFNGTDFLKGVAAIAKDGFAAFPESFTCSTGKTAQTETIEQPQATANIFPYFAYPILYIYKQFV